MIEGVMFVNVPLVNSGFSEDPFLKSMFIEDVVQMVFQKTFFSVLLKREECFAKVSSELEKRVQYNIDGKEVVLSKSSELSHIEKELRLVEPQITEHGGILSLVGFDHEKSEVMLSLGGACLGCPFNTKNLRNRIESAVKVILKFRQVVWCDK